MLLCLERETGRHRIPSQYYRKPCAIFADDGQGVGLDRHHIKADPEAKLWAIIVGEEGPGRWVSKLTVSGCQEMADGSAPALFYCEVTDSRAGLVKLRNAHGRQITDEFCIIVFEPQLPTRGAIHYDGDVVSWECTERAWLASYSPCPLVPLAIGEVGHGAAGTVYGHGEHMVALLPRGKVCTVRRTGRLKNEEWNNLAYYFDGAKLYIMSPGEREKLAEKGLVPARLSREGVQKTTLEAEKL